MSAGVSRRLLFLSSIFLFDLGADPTSAARKISQGRRDGAARRACPWQIEHRAMLARYRWQLLVWLSPVYPGFASWTGPASRSMARAMIAPTYIRQLRSGLPTCCMHGLIAREGWGSSFERQISQGQICNTVVQPHIRPVQHTRRRVGTVGALPRYRGYRLVRMAPCGTRPCST